MNRPNCILLVDDEAQVRAALAMMLGLDGHRVTEAENAQEALRLFSSGQFDMVITDFAMPDMKGNELAARIKRLSPSQKVVMITGHEKRLGRADNPVDAILEKPFGLEELRELLARLSAPAAKGRPRDGRRKSGSSPQARRPS